MSFKGPSILKVNGGLGQQAPSDRNVAGIIFPDGFEVGDFTFGPHKFTSLDEAEAKGLNAAADSNGVNALDNGNLPWYHISEFFRLNPDGTLYVFNCDGSGPSQVFKPNNEADQLMAFASNAIRYIGCTGGFDLDASYGAPVNGFLVGIYDTCTEAQGFADRWAAINVYVDVVVVEGLHLQSNGPDDLKTWEFPQVHVTVACDHGYMDAAGFSAAMKKTSAVGTALGSIGVRMLSESIGSVDIARKPSEKRGQANYSLVDTRKGRWLTPGLSDGASTFDSLPQNQRDLYTALAHGYAGRYEGYPGVYYNQDATCTLATDDFNTIHANRVWNECARRIRRALIPRMNSRVSIDPTTGRIKPSTIADWDAAAKRELDALLAEGEIADYRFVMDPNQDVIATGKVATRLRVVPQGISKAIESEIGFTNPAQA